MAALLSLRRPSARVISRFLKEQRDAPFSYPEVAGSRELTASGLSDRYRVDFNRIALGRGDAVFSAACRALLRWRMFPSAWTEVRSRTDTIEVGTVVAVSARVFGGWCTNACRVVYLIDETKPARRFGFAYGTLPSHAECGEEKFVIVRDHQDVVWYELNAFSRANAWFAKIGGPFVRRLQRRFMSESLRAMQSAIDLASK
jgi:uncharacterized protein (UPF0548 family)